MIDKLNVLEDISGLCRYSYSKLSSIWQCPYSFDLSYNYGKSGEQNCFALCGSFVHEIIEKYLKGDLLQCEIKDYFIDNFDNAVPDGIKLVTSSGYEIDLTDKYLDQISSFLDEFSGFYINGEKLQILETEKQFVYVVDLEKTRFIFNGILDVVAKDADNNFYILDHKSKAGFKNEEERKAYSKQLYLYSIYLKQQYGCYPKAIIFDMFRINELEIIPFNEDEFEEALDWMSKSIQKIKNEELFLPVNFDDDLKEFELAKNKYDNLPYSYQSNKYDYFIKSSYKKAKDNIEDKLFFCMNLCNHKQICDTWKQAQYKFCQIAGDKT